MGGGRGAQEGTGCAPTATSLCPHRVHAPCKHLRNVGLDVLREQLLISQEAVEDTWVIGELSFPSQVPVEVLGVFFSCGAGRKKIE